MSMANRIIIPIGTKFGRLTVIDNSELKHLCRCECGTIKSIDMYSLLKGDTMSCGCFHKEMSRDMLTTHGLSKTRLHSVWATMLSRCHNEKKWGLISRKDFLLMLKICSAHPKMMR